MGVKNIKLSVIRFLFLIEIYKFYSTFCVTYEPSVSLNCFSFFLNNADSTIDGTWDDFSDVTTIILNILGSVNFDYSNGIYMWKNFITKVVVLHLLFFLALLIYPTYNTLFTAIDIEKKVFFSFRMFFSSAKSIPL